MATSVPWWGGEEITIERNSETFAHPVVNDPVAQAKILRQIHEATLSGSSIASRPRPLISQSWERSMSAKVDPEADGPPLVFAEDDIPGIRESHPLADCMPLLRHTLLDIAEEALHIMIVTDAQGHILWREGCVSVQHIADHVGLSPGTRWAEDTIGTNAMGTTLEIGKPVQVHSAEHLVYQYHSWTCAAAPVYDPTTGTLVGAIDISGPLRTVHPSTVALVNAAARLAETHLANRGERQALAFRHRHWSKVRQLHGQPGALISQHGKVMASQSTGTLPTYIDTSTPDVIFPDGRHGQLEPLEEGYLPRLKSSRQTAQNRVHLRLQGADPPTVNINERIIPIALRHAEILALLALFPLGLNAEQLAAHLYGDRGNPTTVRAEIHRLRTELGRPLLPGNPYRLNAIVTTDFRRLDKALNRGDAVTAAELYKGPLLPLSESPTIRLERDSLIAGMRQQAMDCANPDVLWAFAQYEPGDDDLEVWQILVARLDSTDLRRSRAETKLAAIAAEE